LNKKSAAGLLVSGLPGSKNFKKPKLAISSFKKGQILKNEKGKIKAKFPSKNLLK
jgi:hypothetical protein